MIGSGLIPTKRAVIDLNRVCNAKCRMCYYNHDRSNWSKPLNEVEAELMAALSRGNNAVDFTGGEPTLHPNMPEIIRFAEEGGLHTCIITNGLAFDNIKNQVEAGCREWLVSIHGYEQTHDEIVGVQQAWQKINRTVEWLNQNDCFVRVNCTLTKLNQKDLPELAEFFIDTVDARMVNFINFNPHYQWGEKEQPSIVEALNDVQIMVSEVRPYLREALDILRERNVWTNVRYFPMCVLKGYESHICNNPQVMFDPYEWDYGASPKTCENYLSFGRLLQERINTGEGLCAECGLLDVCGGLNKNYAKIHGFSELSPYSEQSDYPYHFMTDIEADIIVPAFGPNQGLDRLLSEIAEKTVPPYNLIIVSRRQSAAKNRNYGLERSKSPFVIMCDDDMSELPYGWNREMINSLREHPDLLAVSARLLDRKGRLGCNTANNFDISRPLVPVDMIPAACCVFRKTDVRFDERYISAGWEDTDFFVELSIMNKGRYAINNLVQVVHLNEEKNDGGAGNRHNHNLFQEKWHKKAEIVPAVTDPLDKDGNEERLDVLERDETVASSGGPLDSNEQIKQLLKNEQFETALSLLKQIISQGVDDAEVFNDTGYAYWQLGFQEKALDYFFRAARIKPDDSDILVNVINVSYDLKKFKELESYFNEMLSANPQANEYLCLLAECLYEQERYEESLEFIEKLLAREPDYPGVAEFLIRMNARVKANEDQPVVQPEVIESPIDPAALRGRAI